MSGLGGGGRGGDGSRCGSAPATLLGDGRVSGRLDWALVGRATRGVAALRKVDSSLLLGSAGPAGGGFFFSRPWRRAFRAAARSAGRAGATTALFGAATAEPALETAAVACLTALATAASACASGCVDAALLEGTELVDTLFQL